MICQSTANYLKNVQAFFYLVKAEINGAVHGPLTWRHHQCIHSCIYYI